MNQQTNGGGSTGVGQPTGPPSTTDGARDHAAQVGRSTADAGRQVAGTATEQAGEVARETRRQAGDLLDQARQQATEQARGGQAQAAKGLQSLASELHQMADGGDEHGPASDLAKQAAGRVEDLAGWLDRHEPGDILGEVRRLARRRPGAFLIGAAIAGVVAGRLTRGAVDAQRDTGPTDRPAVDPATDTVPIAPVGGPGIAPTTPGYPAAPAYPATPAYSTPPPHGQPGVPALPPQGSADGPTGVPLAHEPRPGSMTVGEYVDELRNPQ